MSLAVVRTALLASAVRTLVGSKVYLLTAPEDAAAPYITLQRLTASPQNALTGYAGTDLETVLVDAWTTEYTKAVAIAKAIRTALEGAGYTRQDETEDYDYATRTYRVSQQWLVWT